MSQDDIINELEKTKKEIEKTKTLWHKIKNTNGVESVAWGAGAIVFMLYFALPAFDGLAHGVGQLFGINDRQDKNLYLLEDRIQELEKNSQCQLDKLPRGKWVRWEK